MGASRRLFRVYVRVLACYVDANLKCAKNIAYKGAMLLVVSMPALAQSAWLLIVLARAIVPKSTSRRSRQRFMWAVAGWVLPALLRCWSIAPCCRVPILPQALFTLTVAENPRV